MSHLRVLETAFADATIVPCAFGMVLRNRQAVKTDLLSARRPELLALLERLDGRIQLNVTASYDEEAVLREVVADEPEIARLRSRSRELGAAGHFERIRLGELVAAALAERRATDAQRVLDRLAPESDDVIVERGGDTVALKASFLVHRDGCDRCDARGPGSRRGATARLRIDRSAAADGLCIAWKRVGELGMGLFTGLLTLPLAPVRGTMWIAERLLDEAERQLNDPEAIEQQILAAEAAHERGELTDEEFERIEEELLERLLGQGGHHAG
jgi:hypothetical protein